MIKTSGYTVVRNGIELDYCFNLAIQSLIPVCEEVVVGVARSTDGTSEFLEEWKEREPKLRVIHQPWNDPAGQIDWFVRWINDTRQHLKHPRQLFLDADEVLDPNSYEEIRTCNPGASFWFERLNFWRDGKHIIPHGRCCGHLLARMGPTQYFMPSDERYGSPGFPGPEPEIRQKATFNPKLRIFHYGFLRRRQALFDKCRVVLKAFFNGYDDRLVQAENDPSKPWQDYCEFDLPLLDYNGPHPQIAHEWLKGRGAI